LIEGVLGPVVAITLAAIFGFIGWLIERFSTTELIACILGTLPALMGIATQYVEEYKSAYPDLPPLLNMLVEAIFTALRELSARFGYMIDIIGVIVLGIIKEATEIALPGVCLRLLEMPCALLHMIAEFIGAMPCRIIDATGVLIQGIIKVIGTIVKLTGAVIEVTSTSLLKIIRVFDAIPYSIVAFINSLLLKIIEFIEDILPPFEQPL